MKTTSLRFVRTILLTLMLLAAAVQPAAATVGDTTCVSVNSYGVIGNSSSSNPTISGDGRFVAFVSLARNLVPGDTNGSGDIFVHDRQTGETTRVSVDSNGVEGNDYSHYPAISANGRFVAFESGASNLVAGDSNGYRDIFVHDRQTGETSRVSVNSSGEEGNSWSEYPAISANGRFVAFESLASNLVAGDSNIGSDVFVHDRQTGETTRVSVDSNGVQGNSYSWYPAISADGRFVAFESLASNLVAWDSNGYRDIFVHDRQTGQTTRASVDSSGVEGNSCSYAPAISADGRFVAFESFASNLVAGDSNITDDIFVHDRQTGETSRVSVDSSGVEGNSHSYAPAISANGRFVAFESFASNLVAGDSNIMDDIFVHEYKAFTYLPLIIR